MNPNLNSNFYWQSKIRDKHDAKLTIQPILLDPKHIIL